VTQDCQNQADAVADVLRTCSQHGGSSAFDGTLTCTGSVISDKTTNCAATAVALNIALREFRGPEVTDGDHVTHVGCAFGGKLYDQADCNATVAALGAMTVAYRAGGFTGCIVTTPTTTSL
jgi:hypothetical protein